VYLEGLPFLPGSILSGNNCLNICNFSLFVNISLKSTVDFSFITVFCCFIVAGSFLDMDLSCFFVGFLGGFFLNSLLKNDFLTGIHLILPVKY
jgi:hypothetical protein